jgi:glutathione S-transferase
MMRVIDHFLDVTPATAKASEAEVREVFDAVGERLADGRSYLCGERFSAADLTFAALAAAVVMPPEYGVPLPQPDELPPSAAAVVQDLRETPAGEHALAMFREERLSAFSRA